MLKSPIRIVICAAIALAGAMAFRCASPTKTPDRAMLQAYAHADTLTQPQLALVKRLQRAGQDHPDSLRNAFSSRRTTLTGLLHKLHRRSIRARTDSSAIRQPASLEAESAALQTIMRFGEVDVVARRAGHIARLDTAHQPAFLAATYLYDDAYLSYRRGKYEEAVRRFQQASSWFVVASDSIGLIEARYYEALTLYYSESYSAAAAMFAHARDLAKSAGDPVRELWSELRIGQSLTYLRDYGAATDALQRGLQIERQAPDPVLATRIQMALARISGNTGRLVEAIRLNEQALQFWKTRGSLSNQATCLRRLGIDYKNIGEYEQALKAHRDCLEIFRAKGDSIRMAAQYTNIGNVYLQFGQLEQALAYHENALDVYRRLGSRGRRAVAHGNIAETLGRLGRLDAAMDHLDEALSLESGVDFEARRAETFQIKGDIYLKSRKWKRARNMYRKALEINEERGYQIGRVWSHLGLGEVHLGLEDWQTAYSHFEQSVGIATASKDASYQHWRSLYGQGISAKMLGRHSEALDILINAIDSVEAGREKITYDSSKLSYFAEKQRIYDAVIELYLTRFSDPKSAFAYLERAKARAFLDVLEGGAEAATRPDPAAPGNTTRDLIAGTAARATAVEEVRDQLKPDEILIAYRVLSEKLAIWTVSRDSLTGCVVDVGRDNLRDLVTAFRNAIGADNTAGFQKAMRTNEAQVWQETQRASAALAATVLAPVWHRISTSSAVYVLPDDALNYVPFAALAVPDGANDAFLAEQIQVVVAPSTAVLARTLASPSPSADRSAPRVLALADPRGDLPHARETGEVIGTLFRDATVLTGESATKHALAEAVREPFDIIHLGTHCLIDEQNPLYSVLQLADRPNSVPLLASTSRGGDASPSKKDIDTDLFIHEIHSWRLPGGPLIVLPACETSLGRFVRGEGLVGMTRAFMHAGASGLMTTLWKIDDRATAAIMQRFYHELRRGAGGYAEALRTAQLAYVDEMRNDPVFGNRAHPYFWAGFEMTGGARPPAGARIAPPLASKRGTPD